MTAAAATPRHELRPEPQRGMLDPMRDRSYRDTALGRDVADWLAWLDLGGAAARTQDQYERDLSILCLAYPNKGLADITDGDIAHVVRRWKNPETRRVRQAAIISFYDWAHRRARRIDHNPTVYLPQIKRKKNPYLETFTPAEQEALMGLPVIDGALCAVLLQAGLRKAEARHLQVKHAIPESGVVVVIGGKGNKDRVVPMWSRLRTALADLILLYGLERDDFLWYDRPGGGSVIRRSRPIADGSFDRWWRRCVDAAGIRYLKPHTTRHTCATTARRRGLHLDEIQQMLGHASSSTTEAMYVHTDADDLAARMALIEAGE